jgi:hypothetical protein
MTYHIKCCGPSQDYFSTAELKLETSTELDSLTLKTLLLENIKPSINKDEAQSMLNACTVATEKKLIADQQLLPRDECLFLLPPVCGG